MRLIAASTLDDYRRSGAYLIDLRTKEEYEQGHIPGFFRRLQEKTSPKPPSSVIL